VAVRADLAHPFGKTLPFEAAAMVEPFACVVHGAQRARVQREHTVAVIRPGTIGLPAAGRATNAMVPLCGG
jgi:threonine dehydrogenase-like Zn-dependent dehydrogenase